jgi:hypothetical protein
MNQITYLTGPFLKLFNMFLDVAYVGAYSFELVVILVWALFKF